MTKHLVLVGVLCLVICSTTGLVSLAAEQDESAAIRQLLNKVESAVRLADSAAYLSLLTPSADRDRAADFCKVEFSRTATRTVVQERERNGLPGVRPEAGYRLIVDGFIEYGVRARVVTWQLDVRKIDNGEWRIENEDQVSAVENLYRLSVNRTKQFAVRNLTISSEDLELTLADGSVFTVDTDQGVTGLVLIGHGDMRFHPGPETEKGQVRIFSGSDALVSRFDAAYLRVGDLAAHLDRSQLVETTVDPRALRRAEQVFREESPKSYVLDLADLTRDMWSPVLEREDFLAEIRTRRFETLTYARSSSEPEDITVFDRRRQRNIAVYASAEKLAARGRFYDEDRYSAYDVIDYDIEVALSPERQWIDGRTKMRLRIGANPTGQLTIRLADSLAVQSVVSDHYGRLFSLRAKGQNAVVVNLPATLMPDTDVGLTIAYSGRLRPQPSDREAAGLGQDPQDDPSSNRPPELEGLPFVRPEPSLLYSNRSYWYPQAPSNDFATATLNITVPASYDCVATGEPAQGTPTIIPARDDLPAVKVYLFHALRPSRYFSFVVSRFSLVDRVTLALEERGSSIVANSNPEPGSASYRAIDLTVQANPRELQRGRELAAGLVDVEQFYQSLIGDSPYASFTLAVVENYLPGGHGPAYFTILNEPVPGMPITWRNDPAAFQGFPEFFLAHEVAHQWWGDAVGWSNYHEQWLSEGFAQYFAALYAQHRRGDSTFASVLRQMRKWSLDQSDQGPVYLGYRLGHIRNEGRVFRALVYNKGAAVLHMLRRLVGDDSFFRGLRRFYTQSRFRKASTEDLRHAMEAESDRSLERFFERWIYSSTLPRLKFAYRVEPSAAGQELVLHFEQTGDVFDIPVTVTIQYADRKAADLVVPVTESTVDMRVPLQGTLRGVDISKDDGTLAEIQRLN